MNILKSIAKPLFRTEQQLANQLATENAELRKQLAETKTLAGSLTDQLAIANTNLHNSEADRKHLFADLEAEKAASRKANEKLTAARAALA